MKTKMMCLMVLCALFLSISIAGAAQYTVKSYPSGWEGGPFIIDPVAPGPDFYTFCLEKIEYFNYGGTYSGTIEPYAVYGGVYIDDWGGTASSSATTDPLSLRTKKLYDFALDNWSTLGLTKLKAIQSAIWASEAEINPTSLTGDALTYYNLAGTSQWTLDRNIMALNLWTRNASAPYSDDWTLRVQSQMIEVPVPEPTTMLLLGLGLLGLGLSRKFRK